MKRGEAGGKEGVFLLQMMKNCIRERVERNRRKKALAFASCCLKAFLSKQLGVVQDVQEKNDYC